MNYHLLNTETQTFITQNLNTDISRLLLKGIPFSKVEAKEVVEQIEAKKRCEKKLPTWFNTKNIYYPNTLNVEQTSSETTAAYKAKLISGASIIDITGGFGVDCYYFSKVFKHVDYCEVNQLLSQLVAHNYKQFNIKNITVNQANGMAYLKNKNRPYDWIYIDPSRRHESKGKVFFLNHCQPNIPGHLQLLFKHSKNILVKTSPLLDFSVGTNELKHVKTIHVVAVNNEVKELLWILQRDFLGEISIETVNIKNNKNEHFNFSFEKEKQHQSVYSSPLKYLYEPNAAILKAGGFNSICNQWDVFKLHKHSHLYTSETLLNFPGRCFKVEKVMPFNKKTLKKERINKANITTRNFPGTVRQIRKKFNIGDGGDLYLFFTTDLEGRKIVICCKKID